MDNARFMKRKVRAGELEVHPTEPVIIVNYEVEATVIGENGETMHVEKKQNKKIINVPDLSANTNIQLCAEEIVQNCNLIHPTKLPQVMEILYHLQQRTLRPESASAAPRERQRKQKDDLEATLETKGTPSLDKIDHYLEKMYEEKVDEKIMAINALVMLTRSLDNIDYISQNEPVLLALARLLREERKSIELTTSIVLVWYNFTKFSHFHPLVSHHKIGDMVMRIVEHEIKRQEIWLVDLEKKKQEVAAGNSSESDFDAERKKIRDLMKRQEKLLTASFNILLNLAEDIAVERKMKKRNIVHYLSTMLDRRNAELLIVTVSFLKKLSIFVENKDEMIAENVPQKLLKLVAVQNEALLNLVLRLLSNLAFDQGVRKMLLDANIIATILELLQRENVQGVYFRLLYQLSMDDMTRAAMSTPELMTLTLRMIIDWSEQMVFKELIALGINLVMNPEASEYMSSGEGLHLLVKRVLKTKDPLLMKMIRNIAIHDGQTRVLFKNYLPDLCRFFRTAQSPDLIVEVAGTLANLSYGDVKYSKLVEEFELLPVFTKFMSPSISEDDILLEVIMLIGTFAGDSKCCSLFARSRVISSLYEIMTEKQDDDEIVLQAVYTFYRLINNRDAATVMLNQTHLVPFLIDLLFDKNPEIRAMADLLCDTIVDIDEEWAKRIRARKFQAYNAEWLDAVEDDEMGGLADDHYDDDPRVWGGLGQSGGSASGMMGSRSMSNWHDVQEVDDY
eukprot:TRINITY_DN6297_c0_g1_i1.p1 TRINITY_DN6297_c0_g1~~TRINITY_DN6297_c0_g1_i1.p1  ORF type:complete len:735 (+),score=171.51 TRINITY_DN6297_c0_g1_i1:274-2478(+)